MKMQGIWIRKAAILLVLFFNLIFQVEAFEPVVILLGPPGVGKGSCAQYLKDRYAYNHISIGDIIRHEIDTGTEIGLQIEEIIRRGDYIDIKIAHALLEKNFKRCAMENKPFIVDGFGRSQEDVDFLVKLIHQASLDERAFVLYLEAPDAVCGERIAGRMICAGCGHVFNAVTVKPAVENRCDFCASDLKLRLNDSQEVTRKRLKYHREYVEGNYKKLSAIYPEVLYDTQDSYETCCRYYDALVTEVEACEKASQLVR